nr:VTT domain-containing protein [Nocardioides panaciterrulae]
MLLGIPWMDPNWLLDHFHAEFVWISLAIVFIECGLLFPFLPGDTLLVAVGLFIAGGQLNLNIFVALAAFAAAAFLGNVTGYGLGRGIGQRLGDHDGRLIKKKHLEQTHEFFDRHGSKALVIGRFVPFVRTYITLVAGITDMGRRKFLVWSAVGAVLWVLVITLVGYFLGQAVPWLASKIDLVILGLLVLSVVPLVIEWWRHRSHQDADEAA